MPISFPLNPTVNTQYIAGGKVWVWDGERWMPRQGNVLVTVGNTTPSTTNFGSFWLDSDTGDLSMYVNGAWVGVTEYAGGSGGGGTVTDLTAVASNVVPTANEVYDLGSPTKKWRDLYLSGNTLKLGSTQISSTDGNLVLPANTVIGNTPITSFVTDVATNVVANTAIPLDVPRIANIQVLNSSFTVIDDTAVDTASGGNIFINGSGYTSVPQVYINQTAASSVTFVNSQQLRVAVPAFPAGTYPVYVINPDGATATFVPGLSFSGFPAWSTAAGSIASGYETNAINLSIGATSNSGVQYYLSSGSIPPGATLFQANGAILGTYAVTNSPTTYNFTVEARDAENQGTLRAFSITVSPDTVSWSAPTNGTVWTQNQYDTVSRSLTASSAAGKSVSYSASGLPTNLSLSAGVISGTLSTYTSNANVTSTITATAATSNRSTAITVYWAITGINYGVSPNTTAITEGQSVTFTITTTNVANGTTLYWTNAGTSVASDFGGTNSGSFTINSGTATVTLTATNEAAYEGSETLIFQVRIGSTSGTVVATAATVTVTDAAATYSVTPAAGSVNEGASLTFNVSTTNVADATTLYWTIGNTSTAAGDFSASSGSFAITSNAGSFTITATSDAVTEGAETFTVSIRTGSTSGTVVATSSSVTINDTSLSPVSVSYLVVAGGGSGGIGAAFASAGGGGAGGFLSGSANLSGAYTVTVGAGGAGSSAPQSGADSSISGIATATGGGAGGSGYVNSSTGYNGGSGGGGAGNNATGASPIGTGTPGQGNNGGNGFYVGGGGGGGAGAAGNGSGFYPGGKGGNGTTWNGTTYAGGGGGSGDFSGGNGGAPMGEGGTGGGGSARPGGTSTGSANTGGGGASNANGGSGIVIIRYTATQRDASATTGSPTYSNDGTTKQYRFTSSGTITF